MKVIDLIKIIIGNNNDILMSYFDIEYKFAENGEPILDKVTVTSDGDELQILVEHLQFMAAEDYIKDLVKGTMKDLEGAPKDFEKLLTTLVEEAYLKVLKTAIKKYRKVNKEELKNGSSI